MIREIRMSAQYSPVTFSRIVVTYQGGRTQGVFMGTCAAAGKECLLLAAFDRDSTLGLVRLYFAEFRDAVGGAGASIDALMPSRDLESDLNSSLDALFGPLN